MLLNNIFIVDQQPKQIVKTKWGHPWMGDDEGRQGCCTEKDNGKPSLISCVEHPMVRVAMSQLHVDCTFFILVLEQLQDVDIIDPFHLYLIEYHIKLHFVTSLVFGISRLIQRRFLTYLHCTNSLNICQLWANYFCTARAGHCIL